MRTEALEHREDCRRSEDVAVCLVWFGCVVVIRVVCTQLISEGTDGRFDVVERAAVGIGISRVGRVGPSEEMPGFAKVGLL